MAVGGVGISVCAIAVANRALNRQSRTASVFGNRSCRPVRSWASASAYTIASDVGAT